MDAVTAQELSTKLIQFLETGDPPEDLFAPDVFCDFTSPSWRLQAQGRDAVVRLRRSGHPSSGRVPRHRVDPTPAGFVLEVEEQWRDRGQDWYCRELFRADIQDGCITELSVYCTGDWDAAQRARHRREVKLLRP
ncbi:MAG TPA: hypothetical protein VKV26_22655 [Dehalococcoidia bacterium]|nr:hypothetical protein [Dehalococcoidia bacterium]